MTPMSITAGTGHTQSTSPMNSTAASTPVVQLPVTPGQSQILQARANALHRLELAKGMPPEAIGLRKGQHLLLRFADGTQVLIENFFAPESGQARVELPGREDAPLVLESNAGGIALADGQELVYAHGQASALNSWLFAETPLLESVQKLLSDQASDNLLAWIAPATEVGTLVAPLAIGPFGALLGAGAVAAAAGGGGGACVWHAQALPARHHRGLHRLCLHRPDGTGHLVVFDAGL